MRLRRRRRDDPRRTPEAAEQARREAERRHDEHVLHRLQQDLNTDTSPATADQRTEEQHP